MPPTVSVGIVAWNSAAFITRCLDAVRRQDYPALQLLVVDNGSTDGTPGILTGATAPGERVLLSANRGFSAAHNLAIARTDGLFYLALNPDVFLAADFVSALVAAVAPEPRVGAATGKLLLDADGRLDSTGIYLLPSQRHLDRGQGELDRGQFDRLELVFGASGAAGFYRREMLIDCAIDGEVFDEDFFAYREDADLAWRSQLLGWQCLYVPSATARHIRRVTPALRRSLPPALNRMSVRNRFLLRIKNQSVGQFARFALPALWRDVQVVGGVVVREHASLPAFADVVRLLPSMVRKRRQILRRRRVPDRQMNRWFVEASRPFEPE